MKLIPYYASWVKPRNLPREIEQELDATGLPWEITLGRKHYQVRLGGKLVGILPRGPLKESNHRAIKNLRAHIRRASKQ